MVETAENKTKTYVVDGATRSEHDERQLVTLREIVEPGEKADLRVYMMPRNVTYEKGEELTEDEIPRDAVDITKKILNEKKE